MSGQSLRYSHFYRDFGQKSSIAMEKGKHKPFLSSIVGTIIYGSLRETGQIVSRPFKF